VTPYHKQMNRLRESLRENPHGTCGMGIGETRAYDLMYPGDAPRVVDLLSPLEFERKLYILSMRLCREAMELFAEAGNPRDREDLLNVFRLPMREISDAMLGKLPYFTMSFDDKWAEGRTLIFEGAQGVLLDEDFGFHPHTTWSKTTPDNARAILEELGRPPAFVYGVVRSYMTRHGAGPLPTEVLGLSGMLHEPHNGSDGWQGSFRCGWFDAGLTRYAVTVSQGVDALVVTHMDSLWELRSKGYGIYFSVGQTHEDPHAHLQWVEPGTDYSALIAEHVGVPVCILSAGPRASDKYRIRPIPQSPALAEPVLSSITSGDGLDGRAHVHP
jgi:adenylosuccinate synthase